MKQEENTIVELLETSASSGAKKVGESVAAQALTAIVNFVKKHFGEAQVRLGAGFSRYLENATTRYNHVRTLATGPEPRSIIGQNNIYVSIGVKYDGKEISTETADAILDISKNIMILGTGGIGKSMLMRYLFLNTANRGKYVPVLLELRKISEQSPGALSILDLIYTSMKDFDVELPKEQFEYSLRLGKYLFLFDGFDEIKGTLASEAATAIQSFISKYSKNACIITSRHGQDATALETFTTMSAMTLDKAKAIQLASKIWRRDEKTKEFCRQLDEGLYEKHQSFAENPLLLSMMFLTFMRNSSIPEHLADFYQKAYDALYSAHDSNDKGYYRRDFQCNSLDESSFKLLLSRFCFCTYFDEEYEFSRHEILSYIRASITKLGLSKVTATNFLSDLRNVVCLIVEDGGVFHFSHRSFQTYFAALYTANMSDEQQKLFFKLVLSEGDYFRRRSDFYTLLMQIERDRFLVNVFEDGLHDVLKALDCANNRSIALLQMLGSAIIIGPSDGSEERPECLLVVSCTYVGNIVHLFERYVMYRYHKRPNPVPGDLDFVEKFILNCPSEIRRRPAYSDKSIDFETLDSTTLVSDEERTTFYDAICRIWNVHAIEDSMVAWLHELNEKRKQLEQSSFFEAF